MMIYYFLLFTIICCLCENVWLIAWCCGRRGGGFSCTMNSYLNAAGVMHHSPVDIGCSVA